MSENWKWSLPLVSLLQTCLMELFKLHSLAFFQVRFFLQSAFTPLQTYHSTALFCSQNLLSAGSGYTSSLLLWTHTGAAGSSFRVFDTSVSNGVSSVPFMCCVSPPRKQVKGQHWPLYPEGPSEYKDHIVPGAWHDALSAPGARDSRLPPPWDSHDKAMI